MAMTMKIMKMSAVFCICMQSGYLIRIPVDTTLSMTLGMLLGRLEIFPILALFLPSTYKKSF